MTLLSDTAKPSGILRWLFMDRVVIGLVIAFAALLLFDPNQADESLGFSLKAIAQITPFFLLAILFTAYAKASGADKLIARAFSGRTAFTIIAASVAGAISPFCSCGVVPLIAAMLASGVPLAPVMAFCISSPIMDPEMFILTAAAIGPDFAVAKTVTAFGMGITAGVGVAGLQRFGCLRDVLKKNIGCRCGQPQFDPMADIEVKWRFWHHPERRLGFRDEIRTNGFFLGKWMVMAFFLESLMVAYIPAEWIGAVVGGNNAFAILVSALVGVPAYMNGYAAIPLISGLLEMGMTPGAALSFVTAGAVSSIPAALAVYALVRRPVFFLYIGIGLLGSIGAGYLFQLSGVL